MPPLTVTSRSAVPLTAGLAAAQLIGTFFVRCSNLELHQSVAAMQSAGWLPFPAGPAAKTLESMAAALAGGLFYTLTIGAGLALGAWAVLYLSRRLTPARIWIAAGGAFAWVGLILMVNLRGWLLFPTLFTVFVPLAVLAGARFSGRQGQGQTRDGRQPRLWFLPLLTLALLTGLWSTQLNERLFTAIRDNLLLSNPAGRVVNDFYYRYTLHAAQAFKSFDQKRLRTWRWQDAEGVLAPPDWSARLAALDMVFAPDDPHADLVVSAGGARMILASSSGDRIEVEAQVFFKDPAAWLKRFSQAGDRYLPFRRLIMAGLLIGFPILLFAAVDGLIGRMAGLFAKPPALVFWRCGTCLALGVAALLPLFSQPSAVSRSDLVQALNAGRWQERVAALRMIERDKLEIAAFPQYRNLLASPLVVERYYLARTLAFSRTPDTFADLLELMRDANPNVVCQAYYALGRRGQREAVAPIMAQMTRSDHWYTQWYGYNALRSLGWHQSR